MYALLAKKKENYLLASAKRFNLETTADENLRLDRKQKIAVFTHIIQTPSLLTILFHHGKRTYIILTPLNPTFI